MEGRRALLFPTPFGSSFTLAQKTINMIEWLKQLDEILCGDPILPTRFFRQGAWSNAYVEAARMIREMAGRY